MIPMCCTFERKPSSTGLAVLLPAWHPHCRLWPSWPRELQRGLQHAVFCSKSLAPLCLLCCCLHGTQVVAKLAKGAEQNIPICCTSEQEPSSTVLAVLLPAWHPHCRLWPSWPREHGCSVL
jgi:hypothetical protein